MSTAKKSDIDQARQPLARELGEQRIREALRKIEDAKAEALAEGWMSTHCSECLQHEDDCECPDGPQGEP